MTEKELKQLSRADLLEMLINQSIEFQKLQKRLSEAEEALQKREIAINNAGSIAEAAIQINGVFEAAEAASQQYMDNIRNLSERQEAICQEMRRKADQYQADVEIRCAQMMVETKKTCADMLSNAKAESQTYWENVSKQLEAFYKEQAGLREPLSVIPPQDNKTNI